MLKHRQTPLHKRPPFVKHKSHKKRNVLIGLGVSAVTFIIAGIFARNQDRSQ